METTYTILPEQVDKRLDLFLTEQMPGFSRSRIQAAIKEKLVKVDGKPRTPHYALREGEVVTVSEFAPNNKPTLAPNADVALPILFEDESIIVVNKPSGLIVHPAIASDTESVAAALLDHHSALAGVGEDALRPGIVHRLDKEASGVLVVAKTQKAYESLKSQFQDHTIGKEYVVLVDGGPARDEGTITFSIGRKSNSGRMSARPMNEEVEGDRNAITHYEVIERFENATYMRIRTETGRTHQIRVHMKAFGCPVIGDALYGNTRSFVKSSRLFLHSASLSFNHPVTGERVTFEAPLPPALEAILERIRK